MSQENWRSCRECGRELQPHEVKNQRHVCWSCSEKKRVIVYLSDEYIEKAFAEVWARQLLKRLGVFFEEYRPSRSSQVKMLPQVIAIFQEAEKRFSSLEDMEEGWLEERVKKMGAHTGSTIFREFLVKEQIIVEQSQDEKRIKTLQDKIEQLPQGYRCVIEVYFNERLTARERQTKLNAKKLLSLYTLESDLGMFTRTIRWLMEYMPEITGWEMVQEEHIHTFLLILPPKLRQVASHDLHMLFRLARKRRLMTHVPVMNKPARQWPQTLEPLEVDEQKALAQLIQKSIYIHPEEAFLTALCFYHCLSASQVIHIKMGDVDIERRIIYIAERPPVYLLAEDLLLLEQFLQKRKEMPYAKHRSNLFIGNVNRLDNKPLGRESLSRKVQSFAHYSPQRLRITCFIALTEHFGSQYLVVAFGLSFRQAARYGKMEEYLLEEEVKQQQEEFLELSRQLEQSEKQHAPQ